MNEKILLLRRIKRIISYLNSIVKIDDVKTFSDD